MSEQRVSRVFKRVLIKYHTNCSETNVTLFSQSVQVLPNGPKILFAVETDAESKSKLWVATVDGLDLAVSDFSKDFRGGIIKQMRFTRNFLETKTFLSKRFTIATVNCSHFAHVVGRHHNYSFKMVDRLMSGQLWHGNRAPPLFSDVEFVVSGVVFKAHRAIVALAAPSLRPCSFCVDSRFASKSPTSRQNRLPISSSSFTRGSWTRRVSPAVSSDTAPTSTKSRRSAIYAMYHSIGRILTMWRAPLCVTTVDKCKR